MAIVTHSVGSVIPRCKPSRKSGIFGGHVAETIESNRDWRAYWNAVGERAGPQEFFRQVGWTIGGQPVDDDQVALAVEAAQAALDLNSPDRLLDLCCGNGLVTSRLARSCASVYALDFSRDLIEAAIRYHSGPNLRYLHGGVSDLNSAQLDGWQPNKVCMLVALQFFAAETLVRLIHAVSILTGHAALLYASDIPDIDHLYDFYDTLERRADYEQRRAAGIEAIGTWWSRRHLAELFESKGYAVEFRELNRARCRAHYRFDLLARPMR